MSMRYEVLLSAPREDFMREASMSDTQLPTVQQGVSVKERELPVPVREEVVIPYLETTARAELTPSDLVLLRRLPWTNQELNGVLRVQVKYTPDEIITEAVAAAILANEEAGAICLGVTQKKVFFELFTRTTLRVIRTGNAALWPGGSLEASLDGDGTVSDIIYRWLGKDYPSPRAWVMEGILTRMVSAEVLDLEVVEKRVLKLFTVTSEHYVLPNRTSPMLMAQSLRLLEACKRARPEVYDKLMSEIGNGFSRRTESPDCGD